MSDTPEPRDDEPDERDEAVDPFAALPPELRAMVENLGGPGALDQAREQLAAMFGGGQMPGFAFTPSGDGPVDWDLATRVALQVAADGDRGPTDAERTRVAEAFELAEHWLDDSPLPASPDAGRLVVGSRQTWVNAAVESLRPLVEPVARAATDAMVDLAREQFGELDEGGLAELGAMGGLEGLPPGFSAFFEQLMEHDPGELIRPAGAGLAGLQAGQVIGRLARQVIGQYELGIPTAPRAEAHHLAVNAAEDLGGYGLDEREVAVMLALTEVAHRRLYHAVPWLEAHLAGLVARFAAGTEVDARRLQELSEELAFDLDPEDPEALQRAMERAGAMQLEPTDEQRRVLVRLQGVVCLVGAWARQEVERVASDRLPSYDRIQEVLRRRRATRGDGEELLATLLGIDLKPDDETVGESFVRAVEDARGPAGLHRALAHPENLPDGAELADPAAWLARTAEDPDVPDDAAALFGDLGEAPHEASAAERRADPDGDASDDDPQDGEA